MQNIHTPTPEFKSSDTAPRGAIDPVLDFRLAYSCQSLHALGPRALCELIKEIEGRYPDVREFLRERLAVYNRIDAGHIKTLTDSGGFPPPPIYQVRRG